MSENTLDVQPFVQAWLIDNNEVDGTRSHAVDGLGQKMIGRGVDRSVVQLLIKEAAQIVFAPEEASS